MMPPRLLDEDQRLQALQRYDVLDTPPEEAFDRITRLAARLFDVPIALVSLVADDRQYFKSCLGLPVRGTSLEVSFCVHALGRDDVLVVEDARRDPRFADNALVTGAPHVRFYAGAPLTSPDGYVLGTLCIIDRAPRTLRDDEAATLADLAAMVVDELELRREVAQRGRTEAALREKEAAMQRSLQALQRERDYASAALRTLADPFFVIGPDGQLLRWNARTSAVTGYPDDELAALNALDLFAGPDAERVAEAIAAVCRDGEALVEAALVTRDGRKRPYEFSGSLLTDENGQPHSIVGIGRDLAERKEAETHLRASEQKYRTLFEQAGDAVLILDPEDETILDANQKACAVYGCDHEALVGTSLRARSDDPERGEAQLHRVLREGAVYDFETVQRRQDGSPIHLLISASLIDYGGRPAILSLNRDVTARRAVERALREAQERLEAIASNLPGAIFQYHLDADGTTSFPYINGAILPGVPTDVFRDRADRVLDFIDADDRAAFHDTVAESAQKLSPWRWEGRVRTRGRTRWLHGTSVPTRLPDGGTLWNGVVTDVTERKQAEDAVRRQRTMLQSFYDASPLRMGMVDVVGDDLVHVWDNHAAAHAYGLEPADLQGRSTRELGLHGDLRTAWLRACAAARAEGAPQSFEFTDPDPAGDRHLRANVAYIGPARDGSARFSYTAEDTTERRRMEDALRASRNAYQRVVDSVTDTVFELDLQGRWTFLNAAWAQTTGFPVAESLGRPCLDFVHPDDLPAARRRMEALLARGGEQCHLEFRCRTRQGGYRWVEAVARLIAGADGRPLGAAGTLHDVTERREALDALETALHRERELGRLKSRFVSMASHELRTPLTTIKSSAELLQQLGATLGANRQATLYERIHDNVDRMTHLIGDVLLLGQVDSDRLPYRPERLDLTAFCGELVDEVRRGEGGTHRLRLHGPGVPLHAEADPRLLRLLLGNLLSNAVKYSPRGSAVVLRLAPHGSGVAFAVEDQGIGIPDDDLPGLFEPFQRAANAYDYAGTGLGLAIARRVADVHGGTLTAESTLGEGTTFTFTLPAWLEAPAHP